MSELDALTAALVEAAHAYLANSTAKPFTTEEYLRLLLRKGIENRLNGNYGIAALYILRSRGIEAIFVGLSTVVSDNNPHAHAEMSAVKLARDIGLYYQHGNRQAIQQQIDLGNYVVRALPEGLADEQFVVTSLEPCPMCTVGAVLLPNVSRVLIGAEDPDAGTLEASRLRNLPPLWSHVAEQHKLRIQFAQAERAADEESYAPAELIDLLWRMFSDTREPLDAILYKRGFFDTTALEGHVHAVLGSL